MEMSGLRDLERRFEARLRSAPQALDSADVVVRVLDAAGPVRGLRTLDAGCGTGELCRRLSEKGASAFGVDLCHSLLARAACAAPRARFARADAEALPLGSGRFDLATSVLVLHYLGKPARGLREIARVLRPGGRLIVCDRVCSADPVLRAAQVGIERLRNPLIHQILSTDEIEEALRDSGFEILPSVEFRRVDSVASWLAGLAEAPVRELRQELMRLRDRDLGGLRVMSGDRIELRMALVEARVADGGK